VLFECENLLIQFEEELNLPYVSKTLGLATTRTFPCFPQSNCIYKQQINKLHRSLFNFLPQRRRKLSTCPHVLNFLAHALSFLLPKFDKCVLCTCKWKSIGFHLNSFQKSRPAFFKTTLFFTIDKKKQFELLIFHARFACHFPLQFRKTIGSQSEAGNQIGDVIARRRIQKEEEAHASN